MKSGLQNVQSFLRCFCYVAIEYAKFTGTLVVSQLMKSYIDGKTSTQNCRFCGSEYLPLDVYN